MYLITSTNLNAKTHLQLANNSYNLQPNLQQHLAFNVNNFLKHQTGFNDDDDKIKNVRNKICNSSIDKTQKDKLLLKLFQVSESELNLCTATKSNIDTELYARVNEQLKKQSGGGKKIHILGSDRKIYIIHGKKYITYNKEKILLTEARKLRKKTR
jgi:hypothetical protein